MVCARALVLFMIGENFFISEEFDQSENYFEHALILFDKVDDGLKLRFFNTIQQIYNTIGLLKANKIEEQDQAIKYFEKSAELYAFVYEASEGVGRILPKTNFNKDFENHLITQVSSSSSATKNSLARSKVGQLPETQAFGFYINGGLDITKLEATQNDTLMYMSSVFENIG